MSNIIPVGEYLRVHHPRSPRRHNRSPPLAATLRLVQVTPHSICSCTHPEYSTASVMIDHFPFCKECVEIESIYIVSNWSLSCSN